VQNVKPCLNILPNRGLTFCKGSAKSTITATFLLLLLTEL
jgi:hypothetical protein